MLRQCGIKLRYSLPRVRPVVSSADLRYTANYRPAGKVTLSDCYNVVSPENRFTSLKLMLEDMTGHIGRRQVKFQCNMERLAAAIVRS